MYVLVAARLALLANAGLVATVLAADAQEAQPGSRADGLNAETTRRLFIQIDQNADGQITPEEWSSWHDTEFAAATANSRASDPAAE